jgi:hypothetical protein
VYLRRWRYGDHVIYQQARNQRKTSAMTTAAQTHTERRQLSQGQGSSVDNEGNPHAGRKGKPQKYSVIARDGHHAKLPIE